MKSIAVEKNYELKFVDVPMPVVEDDSALVKTIASGICGTDAKLMHGTFKGLDRYPCLLGHEAVGEVVEVGKNVESFKVGDRVLLPYVEGETEGYFPYWGAFSEYGIVRDWKAMVKEGKGPGTPFFTDSYYTQKTIPSDFDPVSSVMIITLREVLAAAYHFGFQKNQSIVIFGAGPVGLSFAKFAKILGMGPVIVVDVVDEKVKEAEFTGADYAFNSTKTDIISEVHKICPDGTDYSLDAVGINDLITTGMQLVRDNGRILTYGISPKLSMNLDWSKAQYNWSLELFQFPIKAQEGAVHQQLINWVQMGIIDPGDFISHVFDFKDAMQGFDIIEKRKPSKKIVIKY